MSRRRDRLLGHGWTMHSVARMEWMDGWAWVDVRYDWKRAWLVATFWDSPEERAVTEVHRNWPLPCNRDKLREIAMSFLKRQAETRTASQMAVSKDWEHWSAGHPALSEYLTATEYPDGAKRTTSTILLFVDAGMVKACLNDRDQGQSLWVSASTPTEALQALERHLSLGTGEWRPSGQYGQARPNGKKGK